MRLGALAVVLALLAIVAPRAAQADTITVGLFAPAAPFPSTSARVELATKLAEHLGKALGGSGVGRVYARAGDFAAAVKKGEISIAVVDATYLAAAGGNYTALAGTGAQAWQLVARGASKIGDLRGKRVLVPANGGREADLVLDVLLAGEVPRDLFAKIEAAPDAASAVAGLGVGKADAAVVPVGVELPSGVTQVLALPALAGPVLVAYGTQTAQQKSALTAAAVTFKGDATISGFRGDANGARAIAARFTIAPKRGPFAVPAVRLVVGDLVEGRTFAIERTPPAAFAVAPAK